MSDEDSKRRIPSTWTSFLDKNLNEAVQHLFEDRVLDLTEIGLVRDYLAYYINAACWNSWKEGEALADLRERVTTLSSTPDIRGWIQTSVSIGIDPF